MLCIGCSSYNFNDANLADEPQFTTVIPQFLHVGTLTELIEKPLHSNALPSNQALWIIDGSLLQLLNDFLRRESSFDFSLVLECLIV